jgi:hypothetical protein
MSIITAPNHKQTAEVEFSGKHPDIFSSYVAARFVKNIAEASQKYNDLHTLRVDINVQTLASAWQEGSPTPVIVNIGGQVTVSPEVNLQDIAKKTIQEELEAAGYLKNGDFDSNVSVSLDGITVQSPNLNKTTYKNAFADSCVVYGHYIAKPFGLNGTYPSLIIAQQIDEAISQYANSEGKFLRPDGKVHVTITYQKDSFIADDVYISVSHAKSIPENWREGLKKYILSKVSDVNPEKLHINLGGDFNVFFLQADSGVSKAKDDVIITGGLHQLGTDRVWGKCIYKASSTLIPYTFALSKVICDVTGAKYASVSGYSQYGQKDAILTLEDIDSEHENLRTRIDTTLSQIIRDRDGIWNILGVGPDIETYKIYNEPAHFHADNKPWKKTNAQLENHFKEVYTKSR